MKNLFVRTLSLLLCGIMLLGMAPITVLAEEGENTEMYITDLRVNNLVEPLGIDTVPAFRWVNRMPGYARAQSAYRIIVATTAEKAAAHEGDMWDSGRVESGLNYDILYGGNTLASCMDYYFAVQVWDESENAVWSDVSKFGTGFFNDAEWSANWIGMIDGDSVPCDIDLFDANWIWFKDGAATTGTGNQYFRKWFTVDETKEVDEVLLATTMDDYGYFFVNCTNVLSVDKGTTIWKDGKVVNITPAVQKGDNIFGARIVNEASSAGFIAKIEVRYTDGSVDTIVTDATWKVSNTATSTSGWERPGYNDTAWNTPDMALAYGASPWKTNVEMPATMQVNVGAGAPMLRKTFDVSKEIKNAKLYVSGLGLYVLYVNGTLPDDTVLNPAPTEYEDTVHYRAYDVTDMLSAGHNALAVELGNYFYNCDFYTYMNWTYAVYRDNPKLLLELHIDYTDGSSDIIVSDESWKTYEYGPTTYNNFYKGEHYDARREAEGWNTAAFDDSAWKNAIPAAAPTGDLVFENMEPVRRVKTFHPQVWDKGNGTYLITVPYYQCGWAKINFQAPAGTEIKITYTDKLDESGVALPVIYGYFEQIDRFVTSGGEDVYEPKFSYKGYEYIQIDNYPGVLTAEDVECALVSTDVDVVGSFETGDSFINLLNEMMLRSVVDSVVGKLMDPTYEKNGWTDCLTLCMEAFNYNYGFANFLEKTFRDMIDCANEDGVLAIISPAVNGGGRGNPVWTAGLISGNYENWNFNGITTAMAENYDAMRKMALYYIKTARTNGWVFPVGGYADWISPNPSEIYTTGQTTHAPEGAGIVHTAYAYRALDEIAAMADTLGKTEDAAEYRAAMANIYTAFNEKFYDAEKGYYDTGYWDMTYDAGRTKYRQTSNILPLMVGLCPAEYEEGVARSVAEDVIAKGYHLDTGSPGTKFILPMLSKYGYGDIAMKIVHQDTYPSWGFWITLGATTLWESYESNARSHCHNFLGTYVDWFYKDLAGVRGCTNGFETVELRPEIHPEIGYVDYSLDTVRGRLRSYWRFTEDNKLVWNVTVPVGTTAHVYLPAAANVSAYPCITQNGQYLTVPSGDYTFEMDGGAFAVDKSLLNKALAGAEALDAEEYTKASQTVLAGAISAAQTVMANENANAYAVCAAKAALEDAVDALDKDAPKAKLAALVESGESIDGETLPNTISSVLSGVIAAAKGAPEDDFADASAALETALAAVSAYGKGNLALGKKVTASSSVENATWGEQKLTDGDRENLSASGVVCGWSSNSYAQHDHAEYVSVDLGATYKIDRVQVMPAGAAKGAKCVAFPRDFRILVSTDGERWTAVYSAENYPVPTTEMQVFNFAAADARYIRFEGTSIRIKTTDGNRYRMQLAELEAYNTAVTYSDIDLDGDVDILDGLKLLKMVLDKDGGVKLLDAIRVLKQIAE